MSEWSRTVRRSPWRALFLLMVGTLVAGQAGSSMVGAAASEPRGKFGPGALEALAKGEATVWVLMKDAANLKPAYTMKDAPRGSYVFKTLRDVAAKSQTGLRAQLDQLRSEERRVGKESGQRA